jgi:predicted nucleic acid-binding protein
LISLDANILVYSVDPVGAAKRTTALDLIRRAAGSAVLTEQALFEFVHVSTRKLGMPRDQAAATVRSFAQTFRIVLAPHDIVDKTMQAMLTHKVAVWDARLLTVCSAAGVATLLSEDFQDGGKYGSVTVIDPFEATNAAILAKLLPP